MKPTLSPTLLIINWTLGLLRLLLMSGCALIVVAYTAKTFQRNWDWLSEEHLFLSAQKVRRERNGWAFELCTVLQVIVISFLIPCHDAMAALFLHTSIPWQRHPSRHPYFVPHICDSDDATPPGFHPPTPTPRCAGTLPRFS